MSQEAPLRNALLTMLARSLLVTLLFLLAVACGQRQDVRLASEEVTTATAEATPTPPTEQPEPTETPEQQPSKDPAPPTTEPSLASADETSAPVASATEAPASDAARTDPPDSSEKEDPGAELWNRSFAATSIEVAGEPRPIVDETERYVMPFRERGKDGIRFYTGCNTGGASLKITAKRFLVADDGAMTAVGCPEPVHKQERWFVDFIHTNPAWELSSDGEHLRLTSGDSVVPFVEQAWDPWTSSP